MPTAADREPHQWTACETVAELEARHISALELLEHYLARQSRLDGSVGAVVATDVEAARQVARGVDAQRAAGHALPPLAGLTMTVKDSLEVQGMPATCGIPALAQHRPEHDADAVALLRAAGAVIYGKTNCPLGAADHQSYNPLFGVTRNPWNAARTVGGSSGGSAAALAAGFSALEIGSDIGGSIRVPAHYCGVYGHKPSFGIVPRRGHIPPMPGEMAATPLAVIGPLARSAADLALAMQVLGHAAPAEAEAWTLRLPAPRHAALRDYRVGLWLGGYAVDDAYAAAISAFADALARQGVQVQTLGSGPVDADVSWATYRDMLFGVIGSGSPESELDAYRAAAVDAPKGSHAWHLARATTQTLSNWMALSSRQAQLQAQWARWFERFDVLLCPVALNVAFEHQTEDGHGPVPQLKRQLLVSGAPRPYLDNLQWPGLATLAHLPSTVRPIGLTSDGLPMGVQIIGAYLQDFSSIGFAKLCDEAFGILPGPVMAT